MLYYIYDDSANILGFKYNGLQYYYQKNYQNDITGIYDSNYNLVVTYKYDAWGKVISVNDTTENNIGTINPFRYRSYYYDEETKLYYLNSRYYNPEWCRFINADGIIGANQDIISLNLYAYVSNNPVTAVDEDGQILGKIWNGVKKIGNSICSFFINTYSKGNSEKKSSSTPKQSKITPSKPGHISLPTKGNPNSTQTKPNGDIRVYGSDGRALKDIDKSHPEHHPELQNPHVHDWSWENGKKSRSKGRNPLPDENIPAAITAGIGVVGVGYLVYRGVRMIPSLLPPLWWTAPANLVTP